MVKEKFLEDVSKLLGSDDAALGVAAKLEEVAAAPGGDRKAKIQMIADWAEEKYPDAIKGNKTALKELLYSAFAEIEAPAPPSTPQPPASEPNKPAMVKVKVCQKMAEYNGHFYDRISGKWIGKDPVEVPETVFVLQKIGTRELIKVS